jgi:hypothetical protein
VSALLDGAVEQLDHKLAGPRRIRRDMVAEVRDGLFGAAAAHEHAGLEPNIAARRALDEFGDVDQVAAELQHELAARHALRTALVVALGFLPLFLAWDLGSRVAPQAAGAVDGPTTIYVIVDVVQVTAGLTGIALAVALRRPYVRPWTLRAAGVLGVGTTAVLGAIGAVMMATGHWGVEPVTDAQLVGTLWLASAATMVGSLMMGRRSLKLSAERLPASAHR